MGSRLCADWALEDSLLHDHLYIQLTLSSQADFILKSGAFFDERVRDGSADRELTLLTLPPALLQDLDEFIPRTGHLLVAEFQVAFHRIEHDLAARVDDF